MATAKKTTKKTTPVKPKVGLKGVTVAAKAEAQRSADAAEQAALLASAIAKKAADEAAKKEAELAAAIRQAGEEEARKAEEASKTVGSKIVDGIKKLKFW